MSAAVTAQVGVAASLCGHHIVVWESCWWVDAMSEDAVATSDGLSVVRAHRIRLRRAAQELEAALAAPMTGRLDGWVEQVTPAVHRIRQAFTAHVSMTEGRGGLFDQIRTDAPRLVSVLAQLHREHGEITAQLAAAADQLEARGEAAMERVRERLTTALSSLSRHRQRGADLLYEAYQVDLGGE
jgi:Hemerythrin HHE cation binding domain